jgi:hypothetical protein
MAFKFGGMGSIEQSLNANKHKHLILNFKIYRQIYRQNNRATLF